MERSPGKEPVTGRKCHHPYRLKKEALQPPPGKRRLWINPKTCGEIELKMDGEEVI
ncbi:MAG: hypothetical protein RIH33_21135 [Marinoscillum sp.]